MTSTSIVTLAVIGPLAQLPFTEQAWQVAVQSGFNAVLVLILMYQGWKKDEAIRERLEHDSEKFTTALNELSADFRHSHNHLTTAITQVTLAMPFVPPAFHDQAKELQRKVQAEDTK